MHRPLAPLLLSTLALSIACGGGASVDPRTHIEGVCARTWDARLEGELAAVDVPATAPAEGIPVRVALDGLSVAGREVSDEELSSALREELDQSRLVEGRSAALSVVLSVHPEVPAARVHRVAAAADAAQLAFVVRSSEAWDLPPYPDPEYGSALAAELAAASPDVRQQILVETLYEEISLCPGALRTFEALASASPDHRCVLLAAGIAEALPSCPLTDGDRVVTGVQILVQPTQERRPAAVTLTVDPEAEPLALGEGSWGDVAAEVAKRDGEAVSVR